MRLKSTVRETISKPKMPRRAIAEATFENANEAIFIVTTEGEIADANKRARALAERNGVDAFLTPRVRAKLKIAAGVGAPIPLRLAIDGVDHNAQARRLVGAGQPFVMVKVLPHKAAVKTFSDLNDKIDTLNRLALEKRQRASLEEANEELDRFVAIAAHDLNAPLRQITVMIGMMRSDLKNVLDTKHLDQLGQVEERAQRLGRLVKALLDYSRTANSPISPSPLDLNEVVERTVADLTHLIDATGGCVDVDTLPIIEADAVLAPQLFQNLISNALKYHRDDAPPAVRVYSHRRDNRTRLCIEDNGIGVAPEYADRIFDPFGRIGDKKGVDGVGVGLSIVKMITAKHGWDISIASKLGEGTTVSVDINA